MRIHLVRLDLKSEFPEEGPRLEFGEPAYVVGRHDNHSVDRLGIILQLLDEGAARVGLLLKDDGVKA